jgi:hypothetical protein
MAEIPLSALSVKLARALQGTLSSRWLLQRDFWTRLPINSTNGSTFVLQRHIFFGSYTCLIYWRSFLYPVVLEIDCISSDNWCLTLEREAAGTEPAQIFTTLNTLQPRTACAMARHIKMSESPALEFDDDIYGATPEPNGRRQPSNATPNSVSVSPSRTASTSSDKENMGQSARNKGKGHAAMAPPRLPTPSSNSGKAGKRKRPNSGDTSATTSHRRRRTEESRGDDSDDSADAYDPDQPIEERRVIRGQLRDIEKDLTENRAEYLQPESTGLLDALHRANEVASSVKQPTDATIDSRILVTTADYAYKKTVQAISGESVQGVDADQFIAKCIGFMRRAEGAVMEGPQAPSAIQRRRRRQNEGDDSDDAGGDDGDMLNWAHLGRFACIQHNARPSVPGFLLGPLSVEKRARKPVQRRQGLKHNSLKLTQPDVVSPEDVEKSENANLTVLCSRILARLKKVQRDGQAAVEKEYTEDMSQAEINRLMDKYGVNEGGGVDYFRFVVNPYSFGQTVENMFYVSFLIRDGKAGITIVDNGLPVLGERDFFYAVVG